jgi:hypothetical protein
VAEVEWLLDGISYGLYPGYFVDEAGKQAGPKRASVAHGGPQEPRRVRRVLEGVHAAGSGTRCRSSARWSDKGNAKRFGIMGKAFHDALKRAFWGERDLLKMYKLFFSGYPSLYTVYEDFVAAAHHHYEGEDEECWNEPKVAPYTHAGWRELGPNSAMVVELCRRLGRRCRIIHNDTCIYQFLPENPSAEQHDRLGDLGRPCLLLQGRERRPAHEGDVVQDASAPVLQTRNEYDRRGGLQAGGVQGHGGVGLRPLHGPVQQEDRRRPSTPPTSRRRPHGCGGSACRSSRPGGTRTT